MKPVEQGNQGTNRSKAEEKRTQKQRNKTKKQQIYIYIYHIMTIRKNTYTLYAEYIDHIEHH